MDGKSDVGQLGETLLNDIDAQSLLHLATRCIDRLSLSKSRDSTTREDLPSDTPKPLTPTSVFTEDDRNIALDALESVTRSISNTPSLRKRLLTPPYSNELIPSHQALPIVTDPRESRWGQRTRFAQSTAVPGNSRGRLTPHLHAIIFTQLVKMADHETRLALRLVNQALYYLVDRHVFHRVTVSPTGLIDTQGNPLPRVKDIRGHSRHLSVKVPKQFFDWQTTQDAFPGGSMSTSFLIIPLGFGTHGHVISNPATGVVKRSVGHVARESCMNNGYANTVVICAPFNPSTLADCLTTTPLVVPRLRIKLNTLVFNITYAQTKLLYNVWVPKWTIPPHVRNIMVRIAESSKPRLSQFPDIKKTPGKALLSDLAEWIGFNLRPGRLFHLVNIDMWQAKWMPRLLRGVLGAKTERFGNVGRDCFLTLVAATARDRLGLHPLEALALTLLTVRTYSDDHYRRGVGDTVFDILATEDVPSLP